MHQYLYTGEVQNESLRLIVLFQTSVLSFNFKAIDDVRSYIPYTYHTYSKPGTEHVAC